MEGFIYSLASMQVLDLISDADGICSCQNEKEVKSWIGLRVDPFKPLTGKYNYVGS